MSMMRLFVAILSFCITTNYAHALSQNYTQMQLGGDETVTPYTFGANINGIRGNLGSVSAAGGWLIPFIKVPELGTAASRDIGACRANVPLLNGSNAWGGAQNFSVINGFSNVKGFGAKGDTALVGAGVVSITSGSTALTVVNAAFAPGDVGKKIRVPFAGTSSGLLSTTIAAYIDAAHVTLANAASSTVSSRTEPVIYGTDDTTAFQNALNATNNIYVPRGLYFLTATLNGGPNCKVNGEGPERSMLIRTDAFGDTLQCGLGASAGSAEISGLWFLEPQYFVDRQTTALPFSSSANACHVRLYGAQGAKVARNYFYYMPNGICQNGGTLTSIVDNKITGVWDTDSVSLQEGQSAIRLANDATYGSIKDQMIYGNQAIGGEKASSARSVSITSSCGTTSKSMIRMLGPKYGIYAEDGETIDVAGNFFGAAAYNAIYINNKNIALGWRIRGNKFDDQSHLGHSINISNNGTNYVLSILISGNEFNGEGIGLGAIKFDSFHSKASVYHAVIEGNTFGAYIGSPIIDAGAVDLNVTGNVFTDYNVLDICSTDPAFASGIYITGSAGLIATANNTFGGGINTNDSNPAVNYTAWGVYSDVSNVMMLGPDKKLGLLKSLYGGSGTNKGQSFFGRVGVNINSPSAPLDVRAEANGADTIVARPASGSNFLTIKPEISTGVAQFGYWIGTGWGDVIPATPNGNGVSCAAGTFDASKAVFTDGYLTKCK